MRSLVRSILVLFIVSVCSTAVFSQATITIKLLVDTENFDQNDLTKSCSFVATWSNSNKVVRSNGDLEGFVIDAVVDDVIVWVGESTTSGTDIVDIKKVDRGSGSKIFKNDKHNGRKVGNSNKETIQDKVLYDTRGKEDYKYDISFKINGAGKNHKIDPKIKIIPRG
ncbi:MAG: hypothetical protein ACI82Q_002754 [Nonlabens sp.]|jgi:hypothetical protein